MCKIHIYLVQYVMISLTMPCGDANQNVKTNYSITEAKDAEYATSAYVETTGDRVNETERQGRLNILTIPPLSWWSPRSDITSTENKQTTDRTAQTMAVESQTRGLNLSSRWDLLRNGGSHLSRSPSTQSGAPVSTVASSRVDKFLPSSTSVSTARTSTIVASAMINSTKRIFPSIEITSSRKQSIATQILTRPSKISRSSLPPIFSTIILPSTTIDSTSEPTRRTDPSVPFSEEENIELAVGAAASINLETGVPTNLTENPSTVAATTTALANRSSSSGVSITGTPSSSSPKPITHHSLRTVTTSKALVENHLTSGTPKRFSSIQVSTLQHSTTNIPSSPTEEGASAPTSDLRSPSQVVTTTQVFSATLITTDSSPTERITRAPTIAPTATASTIVVSTTRTISVVQNLSRSPMTTTVSTTMFLVSISSNSVSKLVVPLTSTFLSTSVSTTRMPTTATSTSLTRSKSFLLASTIRPTQGDVSKSVPVTTMVSTIVTSIETLGSTRSTTDEITRITVQTLSTSISARSSISRAEKTGGDFSSTTSSSTNFELLARTSMKPKSVLANNPNNSLSTRNSTRNISITNTLSTLTLTTVRSRIARLSTTSNPTTTQVIVSTFLGLEGESNFELETETRQSKQLTPMRNSGVSQPLESLPRSVGSVQSSDLLEDLHSQFEEEDTNVLPDSKPAQATIHIIDDSQLQINDSSLEDLELEESNLIEEYELEDVTEERESEEPEMPGYLFGKYQVPDMYSYLVGKYYTTTREPTQLPPVKAKISDGSVASASQDLLRSPRFLVTPSHSHAQFDWCKTRPNMCGEYSVCTNTRSGPKCECVDGFYRTSVNGRHGCHQVTTKRKCRTSMDCSVNTTCIKGTCQCSSGFKAEGLKCVDIDECTIIPAICDENSHCINTVGGWTCSVSTM